MLFYFHYEGMINRLWKGWQHNNDTVGSAASFGSLVKWQLQKSSRPPLLVHIKCIQLQFLSPCCWGSYTSNTTRISHYLWDRKLMLEIWRCISREKNYHKIQSMCETYFSRYFHSSRRRLDILDARIVLKHFSFTVMALISSTDTARSLISCTSVFLKDSNTEFVFWLFTCLYCLG